MKALVLLALYHGAAAMAAMAPTLSVPLQTHPIMTPFTDVYAVPTATATPTPLPLRRRLPSEWDSSSDWNTPGEYDVHGEIDALEVYFYEKLQQAYDERNTTDFHQHQLMRREEEGCDLAICQAFEAAWTILQLLDSACIVAQCISEYQQLKTTVTTTVYALGPATAIVNSVYTKFITSSLPPVSETTWSTLLSPTTTVISYIGTRTLSSTETQYAKRAVATSPPTTPRLRKRGWCSKLQSAMEFLTDLGLEDDLILPACDEYVTFIPPTLTYFVARPPQTNTVTNTLSRTKTTTVAETLTSTITTTVPQVIAQPTFTTTTVSAISTTTAALSSAWAYCTAHVDAAELSSLCSSFVPTYTPSWTTTYTSTPLPTSTQTLEAPVYTDTHSIADTESATTLVTTTEYDYTTTIVDVETEFQGTVTTSSTSTDYFTYTGTTTSTETTTPTNTVYTTVNSLYRRATTYSCQRDPAGWFSIVASQGQTDQLQGLCKAYLGVPPPISTTTTLVPGVSTTYLAAVTEDVTTVTGTDTVYSTTYDTETISTDTETTTTLSLTSTEVELFYTNGVTTSFSTVIESTVAPPATTFVTTKWTCPSLSSGASAVASTIDALNNFSCWYANDAVCAYRSDSTGGLVADMACGKCQTQLSGAPTYTSYDSSAASSISASTSRSAYVCPSTDIISGTELYKSYVDTRQGAVLCIYGVGSTTLISKLQTCSYSTGNGALLSNLGGSTSNADDNCYQWAASFKCPTPLVAATSNGAVMGGKGNWVTCNFINNLNPGGGPNLARGASYTCPYSIAGDTKAVLIGGTDRCGNAYGPPNPNYYCAVGAPGWSEGHG